MSCPHYLLSLEELLQNEEWGAQLVSDSNGSQHDAEWSTFVSLYRDTDWPDQHHLHV